MGAGPGPARLFAGGIGSSHRPQIHAQKPQVERRSAGTEPAPRSRQHARQGLGHAVSGSHHAVQRALVPRAVADGVDEGIRGSQLVVHDDPAGLRADRQAGAAGQFVPGPHSGGDHDEVRGEGVRLAVKMKLQAIAARLDTACGSPRPDPQPEPLDALAEDFAAILVELPAEEVGGHLHDNDLEPESAQGIGRFQAEKSPAEHDGGLRPRGPGRDPFEVVEGAVREDAVEVGSFDRQRSRRGPGRQDQPVVGDPLAGGGPDDPFFPVEGDHRVPGDQPNPEPLAPSRRRECEPSRVPVFEPLREADAVVRRTRFLADHGDREAPEDSEAVEPLHEPEAHHAEANDHQPFAGRGVRTHPGHGDRRVRACGDGRHPNRPGQRSASAEAALSGAPLRAAPP